MQQSQAVFSGASYGRHRSVDHESEGDDEFESNSDASDQSSSSREDESTDAHSPAGSEYSYAAGSPTLVGSPRPSPYAVDGADDEEDSLCEYASKKRNIASVHPAAVRQPLISETSCSSQSSFQVVSREEVMSDEEDEDDDMEGDAGMTSDSGSSRSGSGGSSRRSSNFSDNVRTPDLSTVHPEPLVVQQDSRQQLAGIGLDVNKAAAAAYLEKPRSQFIPPHVHAAHSHHSLQATPIIVVGDRS